MPRSRNAPYNVAPKRGEVWTGLMLNRLARLGTKTDEIVDSLLPRSTEHSSCHR
jgi:hypothetical protein